LKAWFNYPTSKCEGNKFKNLVFTNCWKIDEPALERIFIREGYKIYISGDQIAEFKKLAVIADYLSENNASSNQIVVHSFWENRITNDGSKGCNQFPKKKYMVNERHFNIRYKR
jgi:hypothetical protein